MKISFITTVLNEEKTIGKLLDSLLIQTKKPDEIVIVDGGSQDRTVLLIKEFQTSHPTTIIYIIVVRGANRAKGRNEGIRKAVGEIIAISDAGCELDKDWFKEIIKPFTDPSVEVVAGYYQAKAKTIFEKCVVPYVLVMPDKINPQSFLPASRSMAIKKSVWQRTGGFPEEFSDNEDYVLANRLKKEGVKIVFSQKAIAYWRPRSNLKDFFIMIYRFARGDADAGLRYEKTATIFGRYGIGFGLLVFLSVYNMLVYYTLAILLVLFYFSWAIGKNYGYVKHPLAFFYLPILQVTADLAVMAGFLRGALR